MMHTFTVNWMRMMRGPKSLGSTGLLLMLTGFIWHSVLLGIAGVGLICWGGISSRRYYAHRKDCISIADRYLMVRQRNAEYIFHAGDIQEIIYGNKICLKLRSDWFDLALFRESKVLQYALVEFGVLNGINVHAAGVVYQERGKYARTRISRQHIS
jgi:hypothetical protein